MILDYIFSFFLTVGTVCSIALLAWKKESNFFDKLFYTFNAVFLFYANINYIIMLYLKYIMK